MFNSYRTYNTCKRAFSESSRKVFIFGPKFRKFARDLPWFCTANSTGGFSKYFESASIYFIFCMCLIHILGLRTHAKGRSLNRRGRFSFLRPIAGYIIMKSWCDMTARPLYGFTLIYVRRIESPRSNPSHYSKSDEQL